MWPIKTTGSEEKTSDAGVGRGIFGACHKYGTWARKFAALSKKAFK
jgi:hypothetical protein